MLNTNLNRYAAVMQAILAAALFGVSAPFSKLLLVRITPLMLSALLYLGAGIGMLAVDVVKRSMKLKSNEARLAKTEQPFVILMILLDIGAPICLMLGLTMTAASNASLLNNFEIVATSVIALVIFKESIGKRLWFSIMLITLSSIMLTISDVKTFSFSLGSVFVLMACILWGLENNCTRKLSIKDPLQIVILKGLGSGAGALIISGLSNAIVWDIKYIMLSLLLGFFAYGLSIFLYVNAQRHLGAARTSAYYSVAPFIGVGVSIIAFREPITLSFVTASAIMVVGTYLAVAERHEHFHEHPYVRHEHRHNHSDGHHFHQHEGAVEGEHTHIHVHEEISHKHHHTPDIHHAHSH